MTTYRRNLPGAFFFGALATALIGGAALSIYESYSLAAAQQPITSRVRKAYYVHPWYTGVCILGFGALFAHFFWGPAEPGMAWYE